MGTAVGATLLAVREGLRCGLGGGCRGGGTGREIKGEDYQGGGGKVKGQFRPQRTHLHRFIQLAIFSDYKNFISLDSLV